VDAPYGSKVAAQLRAHAFILGNKPSATRIVIIPASNKIWSYLVS
jgi:hypothetical protein